MYISNSTRVWGQAISGAMLTIAVVKSLAKLEPGSIGQLAVPLRNQIASKSNGSGVKFRFGNLLTLSLR